MKKIYSFILSTLLILPSIIIFAHHIFEDHKACTETELHFHKDETDCSLCFVTNNTDNSFVSYSDLKYNLVSIDELVIDLVGYLKSNNLRTFNLRAPPVV